MPRVVLLICALPSLARSAQQVRPPTFASPSARDHSSASRRKSGAACIFDRSSLGIVRRRDGGRLEEALGG
jgi:hypothetical protein